MGHLVHPVQLYEASALVVLGLFLWRNESRRLHKRELHPHQAVEGLSSTVLYLGTYSVLRFVLEFFRGDAIRGAWMGLSTSQWISLGVVGVLFVLWRRGRLKDPYSPY